MLTMVIGQDDRFHINVLCFCDGSAFMWGYFYAIRLLKQKSRHGRSSDDDFACQGRCPKIELL